MVSVACKEKGVQRWDPFQRKWPLVEGRKWKSLERWFEKTEMWRTKAEEQWSAPVSTLVASLLKWYCDMCLLVGISEFSLAARPLLQKSLRGLLAGVYAWEGGCATALQVSRFD